LLFQINHFLPLLAVIRSGHSKSVSAGGERVVNDQLQAVLSVMASVPELLLGSAVGMNGEHVFRSFRRTMPPANRRPSPQWWRHVPMAPTWVWE
jgi:hypothetical protein